MNLKEIQLLRGILWKEAWEEEDQEAGEEDQETGEEED
jgi:hypothetical protein